MAGVNKNLDIGFGPITAAPTVHHSATITTTVVKVTLAACAMGQVLKVKITNATAATNRLAWTIVDAGAAAPVFTATPGTGACGVIVPANSSEYIALRPGTDLYIIGSAVSTIVAISSYAV